MITVRVKTCRITGLTHQDARDVRRIKQAFASSGNGWGDVLQLELFLYVPVLGQIDEFSAFSLGRRQWRPI